MVVEPPSGSHLIPEIRHAVRPRNAFGSMLLEGILPLVFWENARAEGWKTPKRQGRQGRGAWINCCRNAEEITRLLPPLSIERTRMQEVGRTPAMQIESTGDRG